VPSTGFPAGAWATVAEDGKRWRQRIDCAGSRWKRAEQAKRTAPIPSQVTSPQTQNPGRDQYLKQIAQAGPDDEHQRADQSPGCEPLPANLPAKRRSKRPPCRRSARATNQTADQGTGITAIAGNRNQQQNQQWTQKEQTAGWPTRKDASGCCSRASTHARTGRGKGRAARLLNRDEKRRFQTHFTCGGNGRARNNPWSTISALP